MNGRQRVSDADLLAAYAELGNVQKVGDRLGIHGSSAHERLVKLGAVIPLNVFTEDERDRLRRDYVTYRAQGQVAQLAAEMGRTVQFLSRQARALGLTSYTYERRYAPWKYITEQAARMLFDQFKASSLGVMEWCKRQQLDDESFREAMRSRWPDEWEHVIESKTPLTSPYRRGRALEYRIRDQLRDDGYFTMRSPSSKSPVDVVAIKHGEVLFVQCKRGGILAPAEWNVLYDLAVSCGALPILAENPRAGAYRYWLLTGHKSGRRTDRQPYQRWTPDLVEPA